MASLQKRAVHLDLIRAVAIVCVVINHAFETVCPMSFDHLARLYLSTKVYYIAGFTLGRIGVPLFLLLSGYLFLPREYTVDRASQFYKHNFFPLLIVWEIWILIYQIFLSIFNSTPFDLFSYCSRVLLLKNVELPHAWYMPMILGIYLFIPFVSKGLSVLNPKALFAILLIVFFRYFNFFIPSISFIPKSFFSVPVKLDLGFSGGIYGFYLVLGYCLAKYEKQIESWLSRRKWRFIFLSVLLSSYSITVLIQLYAFLMLKGYAVWYDFFTMPIVGVSSYLLLKRMGTTLIRHRMVNNISICSFGIYLIHEPVLKVLNRYMSSWNNNNSVKTVVLFACTFSISYCIVRLAALMPKVSPLFLIKGQLNKAENV